MSLFTNAFVLFCEKSASKENGFAEEFQTWGRGGSHLFPAIPSCSVPMVAREEVLVSSVGGL